MAAKKELYEYAVIKRNKGEVADEVIVEPTVVLTASEATARLAAARAVPEEHAEDLESLDIQVSRRFQ